MKRFIDAILIVVFVFLVFAIVFSFFADWQFNSAKKLEAGYLWQNAEAKYRSAIRLEPLNTEYLVRYGDFLREKNVYQQDQIARLLNAEKLYVRALKLNPRCAECALCLGQVKLALFLSNEDKFKDKLGSGLEDFKIALKNDPNGFDISYSIGYAGMAVWDNLNTDNKEWVLDRLKHSLKVQPWYGEYIYSRVWKITRDSRLLQKIRPAEAIQEKKEKSERMKKLKEEHGNKLKSVETDGNLLPQTGWEGKSRDGDNAYKDGNMYWTGTVYRVINLSAGKVAVKIQAKGSIANNTWPHMVVELDGEEIGETFVESPEWKEYSFEVNSNGGNKVLSVTFMNDGGNEIEDRNLYIGEVKVEQ